MADERNSASEPYFEVMVDSFGWTPSFPKGTILKQSDCEYDLVEAAGRGAVRVAPEMQNKDIAYTQWPKQKRRRSNESSETAQASEDKPSAPSVRSNPERERK